MGDSISAIHDDIDEFQDVIRHFGLDDVYRGDDCYSDAAGIILECYRRDRTMSRADVVKAIEEASERAKVRAEQAQLDKDQKLLSELIAKLGVPRNALHGLSAKQLADSRNQYILPAKMSSDRLPIFTLAKQFVR